jgi:hypothetical protein
VFEKVRLSLSLLDHKVAQNDRHSYTLASVPNFRASLRICRMVGPTPPFLPKLQLDANSRTEIYLWLPCKDSIFCLYSGFLLSPQQPVVKQHCGLQLSRMECRQCCLMKGKAGSARLTLNRLHLFVYNEERVRNEFQFKTEPHGNVCLGEQL